MKDLYYKKTCPFCIKVLDALDAVGSTVKLNLLDISESDNRRKLIQLGGKQQVPFLHDGDTKIYESNDIIKYLTK
jgi:glutathione S-transferase